MAQGYNARLDESLGMKHKGPHKQSMKSRRDESKAMSKKKIWTCLWWRPFYEVRKTFRF